MVPSLASLLRPRKDVPSCSSSTISMGSSIRLTKGKNAAATSKKGRMKSVAAAAAAAVADQDDRESVVSSTTDTATTFTSTGSLGGRTSRASKAKNVGRRRRRVRFLFDANDDVQETWVENSLEFTDEEWDRCFTENDELRLNRKRALQQAALFGRKNQLYVDVLQSLLKSPLLAAPSNYSARKRGDHRQIAASAAADAPDATGVDLRPALVMDDEEILRVIGECPERGLEHVMSRDALFFRHKQYVINAVLQRHDQLRRAGDQHGQLGKIRDSRAEVLARFCISLTQSSQDLARRLAHADELQARAIYDETNA
jgi:hypothetical protein